jgi:hypothetical protein
MRTRLDESLRPELDVATLLSAEHSPDDGLLHSCIRNATSMGVACPERVSVASATKIHSSFSLKDNAVRTLARPTVTITRRRKRYITLKGSRVSNVSMPKPVVIKATETRSAISSGKPIPQGKAGIVRDTAADSASGSGAYGGFCSAQAVDIYIPEEKCVRYIAGTPLRDSVLRKASEKTFSFENPDIRIIASSMVASNLQSYILSPSYVTRHSTTPKQDDSLRTMKLSS